MSLDKKKVFDYKLRIKEIMKKAKTSEYGLTEKELKEHFGDVLMKKFGDWIDGQTCAITPDGEIVVYPEDIDRFIRLALEGRPTYWD